MGHEGEMEIGESNILRFKQHYFVNSNITFCILRYKNNVLLVTKFYQNALDT